MMRCLTPDEYAQVHRVSVRTVYRLITAGKVPAYRVGRQWRITVLTGQSTTQRPIARIS